MLNIKKFDMTSFFHNGTKNFFEILSTLAHYRASGFYLYIKIGIYFILYSITYQNVKTELKNRFLQIFFKFLHFVRNLRIFII